MNPIGRLAVAHSSLSPGFTWNHMAELLPRSALELHLRLVRRRSVRAAVQFLRRADAMNWRRAKQKAERSLRNLMPPK